jgi:hypothetical protein
MYRLWIRTTILIATLVLSGASILNAQPHNSVKSIPDLSSPQAQAHRGTAALHSSWYEETLEPSANQQN